MAARQARVVAVPSACGIAQEITGTGIFQGEDVTGDPKTFIPQMLTPRLRARAFGSMECFEVWPSRQGPRTPFEDPNTAPEGKPQPGGAPRLPSYIP